LVGSHSNAAPPAISGIALEALDDPAAGLDRKANLIRALPDDLDGDHGGLGDSIACVAAVGEDLLDERERSTRRTQQRTATVAILNTGRVRFEDEAAPVGVDESMTLTPVDLLARVVAARPTRLCRLDALAVNDRACRALRLSRRSGARHAGGEQGREGRRSGESVCRSRRLLPLARILARLVALGLRRDTVLEGIGITRELVAIFAGLLRRLS
jgi:hypothetical protein